MTRGKGRPYLELKQSNLFSRVSREARLSLATSVLASCTYTLLWHMLPKNKKIKTDINLYMLIPSINLQ